MPLLPLHPLDDQGYSKHRPSTESKFTQLSNLITLDGRLKFRPGFIQVGPDAKDIDAENVEWGIPILIDEIKNKGGSGLTDRPGSDRATETLRPDASTTTVAGWSGDFSDIDEVVPDGVAYLESSTASSRQMLGFTNPANSYDNLYGIVIRGRARQNQPGGFATLEIYYSTTNTLVDSIKIYAEVYNEGEGSSDYWQSFAVPLAQNPITSQPWKSTDLANLRFALVHGGGGTASATAEYLPVTGDGAYSDWVDYESEKAEINSGTTSSYTDFDGRVFDGAEKDDKFATVTWDAAFQNLTDQQISFTMGSAVNTYGTVTSAALRMWIGHMSQVGTSNVNIYFRTGGTDYLVDSQLVEFGPPSNGTHVEVVMTENPATEAAWTQAQVEGSEWVLEMDGGRPVLMAVDIRLSGNIDTTPTLQVDNIAVDIYAVDDPLPDKLLVSTKNYFLLENDDQDFTNIQGSATVTAAGGYPHDSAILYGQIYMVDGTTTRRYPNGPTDEEWEDLTDNDGAGTGKISGRTVAAFADRILYGWVNDIGDVTPERVAYSKEFDGGTHNDNSAGDFDVLITPGGIICLEPLNDDLCACYKEKGIYTIRRTGFSFAPLVPDPIDMETSCLAEATVKNIVNESGDPVHLFLGRNSKDGINVFQFDGINVTAVGNAIHPALRDDTYASSIPNSFAEIDPVGGFYYLFVPEGTDLFPQQAWVLNLKTGNWTRAEFPWEVPVAGRWTLLNISDDPFGTNKMILGLGDNLPYKADYSSGYDVLHPPVGGSSSTKYEITSTGIVGPKRDMISAVMETGDWGAPGADLISWDPKRLHLWFYDVGPVYVTITYSKDGGTTYETGNSYWIGSPDNDGSLRYSVMEFPVAVSDDDSARNSRKLRLKVTIGNDDDWPSTQPDIAEALVEWEPGGEN